MTLITVLIVVATTGGVGQPAASDHPAEVKLFASTMATVKFVTGACSDMSANAVYLAGLREQLHITDADKDLFAEDANVVAAALEQGLATASNREDWCAAAYRLYGPSGSIIPGLFGR